MHVSLISPLYYSLMPTMARTASVGIQSLFILGLAEVFGPGLPALDS